MAKSMRSKKLKRLRAIRRELVQPIYDNKDVAKFAALEAALAAPKLPVRAPPPAETTAMDLIAAVAASTSNNNNNNTTGMEVEMGDGSLKSLKPIGKKLKKKIKIARRKHHGKGKIRKKSNV